ncbi:hypothetical protein FRC17_000823 [Serendipita sp. 399]|nr:hypothetical protein FRC17_000823 [Serendipita sp. 399]
MRTKIVHRQVINIPPARVIPFLQDFESLARLNPFLTSVSRGKDGNWEFVEDIVILKLFHRNVRTTARRTPHQRGSDIELRPPLGVRMRTKWRVEEKRDKASIACILNAEDIVEGSPLVIPFIAGKIRQARSDMMEKLVQKLLEPYPTTTDMRGREGRGRAM